MKIFTLFTIFFALLTISDAYFVAYRGPTVVVGGGPGRPGRYRYGKREAFKTLTK